MTLVIPWRGAYRRLTSVMRNASLLALLATVVPGTLMAQDEGLYTFVFRGAPLSQALEALATGAHIDLLYGADVVSDQTVFCSARDEAAEEVLRCVVQSAGLDFYRLSSGTYVIIEPAEEPARRGNLVGVVVDQETGQPLPFAQIRLPNAHNSAAANGAGMFTVAGLISGEHEVVATSIGYEPTKSVVYVPPAGSAKETFALQMKHYVQQPIVVDGFQGSIPSEDLGQGSLQGGELRAASIGRSDPLFGARTILGVTRRPLMSDLHIQGGESGEHQTQLDGFFIFNPLTVEGILGSYSPLAIDRLTVRKAGFAVPYGSYTAGVVQLEHAVAGRSGKVGLDLQVDPYSINAMLDAPVRIGGTEVTAMAAVRSSLWSVYRVPALDAAIQEWNDVDPVLTARLLTGGDLTERLQYEARQQGSDLNSADIHGALQFRFNPFNTLRASFYRGENEVSTEQFAVGSVPGSKALERITLSRDGYRWVNLGGQVRHEWLMGARALVSLGVRGSRHTLKYGYDAVDGEEIGYRRDVSDIAVMERELRALLGAKQNLDDGNEFTDLGVGTTLSYSLATWNVLELGVEAARFSNTFRLENTFFRPIVSDNAQWRVAGYLEEELRFGTATTLEGGVRVTYLLDSKRTFAEPRVALRFDVPAFSNGAFSARFAWGLYRQFVNQFDLANVGPSAIVPSVRVWLPVDASVEPPEAYHLTGELMLQPGSGWDFRVEGYYKWLPHLLALDHSSLLQRRTALENVRQSAFIGHSYGFAYGAGVRLGQTSDRLRFSVGYDYSVSERTLPGRFDGQLQPTPWNEPHRALLIGDVRVVSGLFTRARVNGVWGRTWGFRQAYYDFLTLREGNDDLPIGQPDETMLPPLYEVDLGASYVQDFFGPVVELSVDVLNVLNRANVLDYGLRRTLIGNDKQPFVAVPRAMVGITPTFTLRITY